MVVIKQAGSYQKRDATLRAWLYTIGRNKVIDFQRRRVNQAYTDIGDAAIPDTALSAEQRVFMDQLLVQLNNLPAEQRDAFMLQQEGFSHKEICKITGVGSETVKSRLRYARASLKQRVGES